MNTIIVERCGAVGYLTLARPGALNALDATMIEQLREGLAQHEADPDVATIVIRSSSERAFCAGGDMRQIRKLALARDFDAIDDFFAAEYALNLAIARCRKPYVALIDGIAMGGGLGVSVHGSHRIVTERAQLAVPEARIGFFPDVGGSYFLPRLAQRAGYWMALTSDAVDASCAVAIGLATHYVTSAKLPALAATLEDAASINAALELFSQPSVASDHALSRRLANRARWFAAEDIESIDAALAAVASHDDPPTTASEQALVTGSLEDIVAGEQVDSEAVEDAARLRRALHQGSPQSIALTLELFDGAMERDLAESLERERAAARSAVRHPDLAEGVRAVLEDREKNRPDWA